MIKVAMLFGVLLSFSGTSAAAETIELVCSINRINEAGGAETEQNTRLQGNIVFNTSSQSVQFGGWPWASTTYWDDEVIFWHAFDEESMTSAAFMFNRSSGVLLQEILSAWQFERSDLGYGYRNSGNSFWQCGRTF